MELLQTIGVWESLVNPRASGAREREFEPRHTDQFNTIESWLSGLGSGIISRRISPDVGSNPTLSTKLLAQNQDGE